MGYIPKGSVSIPVTNATVNASQSQANRPKAKLYLHFGYESNVVDEDTQTPYLISTTYGLAIDTMPSAELKGNSPIMNGIREASNGLTDWLKEMGDNMEPGSRKVIARFQDDNGIVWCNWLQKASEPKETGQANAFAIKLPTL